MCVADVIARHPLRFMRSSSSSMPPQVIAELEAIFKAPLIEAYGMTEATHQMCSNPLPPAVRRPGSVGLPAGPEVAIMGEDGTWKGDGCEGWAEPWSLVRRQGDTAKALVDQVDGELLEILSRRDPGEEGGNIEALGNGVRRIPAVRRLLGRVQDEARLRTRRQDGLCRLCRILPARFVAIRPDQHRLAGQR